MATGVGAMFASHWAIGITGYATPVPESGNTLFAYYAIARKGKIIAKGKLVPQSKLPHQVQKEYAEAVMKKFATLLK